MLSQDLGDIKAGIATSALETQKAVSASNMDINQTLFNQSAAIQQQIGNSNLAIANGLANTNQNIASAMSSMKDAFDSGLIRLGLGNNITPNQLQSSVASAQPSPQQSQQLLNSLNQNPLSFILPVIGQAFTKDQQEWLSQPQILMGIPGFLMSSDGKTILNMMLDSYKDFLNKGSDKN